MGLDAVIIFVNHAQVLAIVGSMHLQWPMAVQTILHSLASQPRHASSKAAALPHIHW